MGPGLMIAGSSVQTAGGIIGQHMANKANLKLQQRQLDWNEQMWHMQNDYNTPLAQKQRMMVAGYHPMLALEGMGGGNAGSPAEGVQPAQMENVMKDFDPVGNYLNLKNASADLEVKKSQAELNSAKAKTEGFNAIVRELDGKEKEIFIDGYAKRMQNETTMSGIRVRGEILENLNKGLDIDLKNQQKGLNDLRRQSEEIRLMYQEVEHILNNAKTYHDIQSTIIGNAIGFKEWQYIKENKSKMPTDSATIGVVKRIIAPTGVGKGGLKSAADWLTQGIRQAIVRAGAGGGTGGIARGFGFSGNAADRGDKLLKDFYNREGGLINK
jgi:hypothetical protein